MTPGRIPLPGRQETAAPGRPATGPPAPEAGRTGTQRRAAERRAARAPGRWETRRRRGPGQNRDRVAFPDTAGRDRGRRRRTTDRLADRLADRPAPGRARRWRDRHRAGRRHQERRRRPGRPAGIARPRNLAPPGDQIQPPSWTRACPAGRPAAGSRRGLASCLPGQDHRRATRRPRAPVARAAPQKTFPQQRS